MAKPLTDQQRDALAGLRHAFNRTLDAFSKPSTDVPAGYPFHEDLTEITHDVMAWVDDALSPADKQDRDMFGRTAQEADADNEAEPADMGAQ